VPMVTGDNDVATQSSRDASERNQRGEGHVKVGKESFGLDANQVLELIRLGASED
jgi:hypothetical protein